MFIHQYTCHEMQVILNISCRSEFIIVPSPIDVILSDTEVRQPDIVMIHLSRISIISKRGIKGVPDLVVEITSEHSRRRDKVQKRSIYAKYHVPEYWIVDPSNFTLEQYVIVGDRYELADVYAEDDTILSKTVPCASFSMNKIVRNLPVTPEMLE
jgi:Uma2 family endonuclease